MLISHSMPADVAWSLVGTGADFLTSADRLDNGRPSSATRIRWLSGAQTTASVLKIRGNWVATDENPFLGLAGLIGTNLPLGLRVVATMYAAANWELSPVEGVVTLRPDGVRVVWFRFPEVGFSAVGIQFAIYNDVGGSVWIDADSDFEIGELWAGVASEWCIRPAYQSGLVSFSKQKLSINGQPFPIFRRAAKTSQLEFTPVIYERAFTDDGFYEESIDHIRSQIIGYRPCVVVPITSEPFTRSPFDMDYVNRHAEFGYADSVGPIVGEAPKFVFSASFQAPPVLLP